MLGIKKLDLYILRNFIGVLFATFFICLFTLLMQFLWKYIDEMIGKGLEMSILAQFFFYVSLTLVPMAFPLSILLASLMTFGNMGERLELLAMKASGISLFRIMQPLIFGVALFSVGAFFFSNNVIPMAQVKWRTLLNSMRDKTDEIVIPENVFYKGISGYSIHIKGKDSKRNLLKDVMIHDISMGFEDVTVTLADSARLQFTDDKKYLVFTLYNGESFENLKAETPEKMQNIPYRREAFKEKQTLIEFDANFNMASESTVGAKYLGLDIMTLENDIDSFTLLVDSLSGSLQTELIRGYAEVVAGDTAKIKSDTVTLQGVYNADTLFASLNVNEQSTALKRATQTISAKQSEIKFRQYEIDDKTYLKRRYAIEWYRKFTLSFACLIFFFIGAPLGAIIRKGGLGVPIIISVGLFIVYYVIDNMGYKFARDGVWEVPYGMWLSAAALLPLGIFLTYKAATDSAIMNADTYINLWKKLRFKKKKNNRNGKNQTKHDSGSH